MRLVLRTALLCRRNPLADIGALAAPEKALFHAIQAGEVAWSHAG